MLKLAAVAFVAMGALAAVSCKKEETKPVEAQDTTEVEPRIKAVKGTSRIEVYLDTAWVDGRGVSHCINDSILQVFDIRLFAVAGADTNSAMLTGKRFALEVSTTNVPSIGKIYATVTPKESFTPDSARMYNIGVARRIIFTTAYEDGTVESDTMQFKGVVISRMGASLTPDTIQTMARVFKSAILSSGQSYLNGYYFGDKSVKE